MELDVPERSGCGGQIDLELIEKYYLHDSRYIGGMYMPPAMYCYGMQKRGEKVMCKNIALLEEKSCRYTLGTLGDRASAKTIPIREFDITLMPSKAIIELVNDGKEIRITYGSLINKLYF